MQTALNTAETVLAALAQTYAGPLKQVQGSGNKVYDYIPWNEQVNTLDAIFGPLGWSNEITNIEGHPTQGIYLASCTLTAYWADEDGTVRSITRSAVGRAVARASRAEFERTGNPVSSDLSIHDTAASAAGSDAFSKATKLLGKALGLNLYDKTGEQSTGAAPNARPQAQAASNGARQGTTAAEGGLGFASPKQVFYLRKAGLNDTQIAAMDKPTVRATMDQIMSGQPVGAAVPAATSGDDFPY